MAPNKAHDLSNRINLSKYLYPSDRGLFRTFELGVLTVIDFPTYRCSRVLTIIDCPNIADAKAPIAPVLNTPLIMKVNFPVMTSP